MRKLLALFLTVLILLSLAGCTPASGDDRFLHVVAHNSLLGVGEDRQDQIVILEEDDFGRVLFAFAGWGMTSETGRMGDDILAALIVQRTTRRHAYFYDGINAILYDIGGLPLQTTPFNFLDEAFVMERFSEEQLEQLKEENDWNKELEESRFFRVRVSWRHKREYMTDVSIPTQREAFESVSEYLHHPSLSAPLTTDKNGNVIYFMREFYSRREGEEVIRYLARSFLFMFDSDGNLIEETGIMELPDENLWDYRDQLREFKEANGWAFYYRETEEE